MKTTMKIVMITLILGVAGKMYAYDFYAYCFTGQRLYYNITDSTNHYVELICPGTPTINGCWSGFTKPTGNIILPESVQYGNTTYLVISIGNFAFHGCNGLTGSLTIPNSVTTIGSQAFDYCSGFTGSLTIPNSVVEIGSQAFKSCSGFTGSLTIPNSVISIGESAFDQCSGFTGSLTIPNSLTSIGESAFFYCTGLTGNLNIPNSVINVSSI